MKKYLVVLTLLCALPCAALAQSPMAQVRAVVLRASDLPKGFQVDPPRVLADNPASGRATYYPLVWLRVSASGSRAPSATSISVDVRRYGSAKEAAFELRYDTHIASGVPGVPWHPVFVGQSSLGRVDRDAQSYLLGMQRGAFTVTISTAGAMNGAQVAAWARLMDRRILALR